MVVVICASMTLVATPALVILAINLLVMDMGVEILMNALMVLLAVLRHA